MVKIDLERVNTSAPYMLRLAPYAQLSYILTTDYGVNYTLSFMPSDLMPNIEAYEFAISNTNHRKSPRDPKLRQTILALVYEFFRKREAVMLYLCGATTGRSTAAACSNRGSALRAARQRSLFSRHRYPTKKASRTTSPSSSVPTIPGLPSSPSSSATRWSCFATSRHEGGQKNG